jgi:alpha-mannosidase
MSWALNNHWIVNFKASQGGLIPLRYRLTTHAGNVDDAAAAKFANEVHNPAVVMRDYIRKTNVPVKSFISIKRGDGLAISTKESTYSEGIVLRVHSSIRKSQNVELDISGFDVKKVESVTALEEKSNKKVVYEDGVLSFELLAGEYASFKLTK